MGRKTAWINHQRKDHFYVKAKQEGFRARSVYKLKAMDLKFHLFSGVTCVLDLCCAPGSWLEYSLKVIQGDVNDIDQVPICVVGVDRVSVRELPGMISLRGDLTKDEIFDQIRSTLPSTPQLVLSDCSPHTSGHREADHEMQAYLFERALTVAHRFLAPGGTFVGKLFQGLEFNRIIREMQKEFRSVQSFKPKASRSTSPEMYIVAKGYYPEKD